jgi:hypothetical protein
MSGWRVIVLYFCYILLTTLVAAVAVIIATWPHWLPGCVPLLHSSGVAPYGALQVIRFHTDLYTETGAPNADASRAELRANMTNDVRSELGLHVDTRMAMSKPSPADLARPRPLARVPVVVAH